MMTGAAPVESEAQSIEAVRQGDRRAFGCLVSQHHAGVVNIVYRSYGDLALAEEAAQEAFLRAWQRLGTFQTGQSFRAWLYRIALHAAVDALRRERGSGSARRSLQSLDSLEAGRLVAGDDDPPAAVEGSERASQVRRAVMALPPEMRTVLVLREWGALSYAEIAAALNIPVGTVMSRLSTARRRLRETLAEVMEEVECQST